MSFLYERPCVTPKLPRRVCAAMARPLVGMVSRLVDQKGFDLLAALGDTLPRLDASFVLLGTGEPRYENLWRSLAARSPDRIAAWIGFDESLAHVIEGGADIFLMPSRFEPCGLNQMYSLRYGTVPVVRATGGLDDTIIDYTGPESAGTGFKFASGGGSCGKWAVHLAFLNPSQITRQYSQMPDGTTYFDFARVQLQALEGSIVRGTAYSIGLGTHAENAKYLAYGLPTTDLRRDAVPIGASCRFCERTDCNQRAAASYRFAFSFDEYTKKDCFFSPLLTHEAQGVKRKV